jgi:cell wall-associated NlpC family hydrolase
MPSSVDLLVKTTREQIIEIARSWKGVRWLHQGASKETGADCEGFVEGVFREAGHTEVVDIVRNYRRREDGSLMLALLEKNLDFVTGNVGWEAPDMSQAKPADILAFCDEHLRAPDVPRHLGIYTEQRGDGVYYVIHSGNEKHGVVEHRMDQRWLKRTHSIWRVRGIDE